MARCIWQHDQQLTQPAHGHHLQVLNAADVVMDSRHRRDHGDGVRRAETLASVLMDDRRGMFVDYLQSADASARFHFGFAYLHGGLC